MGKDNPSKQNKSKFPSKSKLLPKKQSYHQREFKNKSLSIALKYMKLISKRKKKNKKQSNDISMYRK